MKICKNKYEERKKGRKKGLSFARIQRVRNRRKCYSSSFTLFRLTFLLIRNWHFFPNALSNHLEQRVLQLFIKQYTRADVYTLSHDSASLSLITLHNFILRFPVAWQLHNKTNNNSKTMRTTFDRGSNTIINCVFFFVSYVNCNVRFESAR